MYKWPNITPLNPNIPYIASQLLKYTPAYPAKKPKFSIRYFNQNLYGFLFIFPILFTALIISAIIAVPSSPKLICYATSF